MRVSILPPEARLLMLERATRELERSMHQWLDEQTKDLGQQLADQSSALKRIEARLGKMETEQEIEDRVRAELQADDRKRQSSSPWGPPIAVTPRRERSDRIAITSSMIERVHPDDPATRQLLSRHWRRPVIVASSVAGGVPTLIMLWEFVVKRLIEVNGG